VPVFEDKQAEEEEARRRRAARKLNTQNAKHNLSIAKAHQILAYYTRKRSGARQLRMISYTNRLRLFKIFYDRLLNLLIYQLGYVTVEMSRPLCRLF
jgi:hypothetical protein